MADPGAAVSGTPIFIGPRSVVLRDPVDAGGESGAATVTKVYENPWLEESGADDPHENYFLAAVQLQKELTPKLPEICVPCLGAGRGEGRVWMRLPLMRFSLERAFDAKIQADPATIHAFSTRLLQVLQRILEITGRGHGNLKPSNIFLEGEGAIAQCELRLSDFRPLPDGSDSGELQAADLAALGRILYRWVTGQDSKAQVVSDRAPWQVFGKQAEAWMQFCELLLNAESPESGLDVNGALNQLVGLKPRKPKPWGIVGSIAAVLLVGGLITAHFMLPDGLFGFLLPPPPVTEETRQQWVDLVREYNEWGQPVNESLSRALEVGSGTPWHQDPFLFNQVLGFYESETASAAVEMDPWEVVERRVPWQTLDQVVPDFLGRERYRNRTEQSLQFMLFLRERLENWPALERMRELETLHSERAWESTRAELEEIRRQYTVDTELPARVGAILDGIRLTAQIERAWEETRELSATLDAEGRRPVGEAGLEDPLLRAVSEMMLGAGREAVPLPELAARMQQLNDEVAAVRAVIETAAYQRETDLALFRQESLVATWDGSLDPEYLREWQRVVPQYVRLSPEDIPLTPDRWQLGYEESEALLEKIMDLDELVRRTMGESPLTPQLFNGFVEALSELRELGSEARGLPAVLKYRAQMEELNQRILSGLENLQARLREMLFQLRPDPDEWLRDLNERTIAGSAALDREWRSRRDALLQAVPRSEWENDDAVFSRLRAELEAQRSFLAALATSENMPTAAVDAAGIPETLYPALRARVESERERALVALAELVPQAEEGMRVAEFLEESAPATIRESYLGTRRDAVSIGSELENAKDALATGEGLDAIPGTYYREWQSHPVFLYLRTLPDVAQFAEQMEALQDLRESPAPAPEALLERLESAASTFPALGIEAYRKLEETPRWPESRDEFEQDLAARDQLLQRVSGTVANQVQDRARLRWQGRLREAATPEELDTVFGFLAAYGWSADELSPADRFQHFLYEEWTRLSGIDDFRYVDGQVVEENKQRLLRRLAGLEPLQELPEAVGLASELRAYDPTEEEPPPPPTALGPALAGWDFDVARSTQDRYVYSINDPIFGEQRLEFLRMENPEGGSYWVSDIAVSTAIFRMVLDIEGDWPSWTDYNAERDLTFSVDDRSGPRTWEYVGGLTEDPPDGWLFPAPGWDAIGQIYASDSMGSGPEGGHPINYVPAPLALEFASFLHCQLPSLEVWRLMMESFPEDRNARPNIRDATWQAQLEYVINTFTSFQPWPDADTFGRVLVPGVLTEDDALAVDPDYNDEILWFDLVRPAEAGPADRPWHLDGNIAEFLHEGGDFYIAGRSALSPPEISATGVVALEGLFEQAGFSDAGFRLMFVIDRISPGMELMRRIRSRYASDRGDVMAATPAEPGASLRLSFAQPVSTLPASMGKTGIPDPQSKTDG